MPTSQKAKFLLGGKPVYAYLFSTTVRTPSERVIALLFQVEGFSKDDAWKRLKEAKPALKPEAIEFIDYLDPEHDVGYLGEKIDITPLSKFKRPKAGAS